MGDSLSCGYCASNAVRRFLLEHLVQLGTVDAQGGGIQHAFQVGLGDLLLALRTQGFGQAAPQFIQRGGARRLLPGELEHVKTRGTLHRL
ncbi:hypothetical protein [Pseudomonas yamanorum]|uniref:hypothetical protein n=1 Tax=Pseudomonas yamanorum TaxID=515393 RepID=UPI0039B9C4D2